MPTTTMSNIIRQAEISGTTYDLYASGLYVNGATAPYYSSQDILDLINAAANAGFEPVVLGASENLPTANATNYANAKGKIYFKPESADDGQKNVYDEYIMVKGGTDASPTYAWEVIGHTGMELTGITISAPDKDYTGASSATNTGNGGSANITVNSTTNTLTFTGTKATLSLSVTGSAVNAQHSHSIGSTTKYLTKSNVPKTFETTSVVATLKTENITLPGAATTVLTGYESPSTASFITAIGDATKKYLKTTTVYNPGANVSVATAGTAKTVATEGITGYDSPSKAAMATTSISYNTDAIKSYPGSFANLATATAYGAGTTSVNSAGTAKDVVNSVSVAAGSTTSYDLLASAYVDDGILKFNLGKISAGTTSVAGPGSAVTVANGTSYSYATGSTVATGGGASVMVGLGTAIAASKATTTVATGGTTTGTQFLTALGTATAAGTISITPVGGTTNVAGTRGTGFAVVTGLTTTAATGMDVITAIGEASSADAITALGAASTTSVATVGSSKSVVTGASTTANAHTGVASNEAVFSGVATTSATGAQAFISEVAANTGNQGTANASITSTGSVEYTPAGTVAGTIAIPAHSHSMAHTHSLSAHTHSLIFPTNQD